MKRKKNGNLKWNGKTLYQRCLYLSLHDIDIRKKKEIEIKRKKMKKKSRRIEILLAIATHRGGLDEFFSFFFSSLSLHFHIKFTDAHNHEFLY